MKAYDVFHNETEQILNILYIIVMTLLPLLWFGDCKKIMSLFFKRIRLPATDESTQKGIQINQNLAFAIILAGCVVYYLHRRWRLQLAAIRCDVLVGELSFTDTNELAELKRKLLLSINGLIEKRIKVNSLESHRCGVGKHVCPMDDIREDPYDVNDKNTEEGLGTI